MNDRPILSSYKEDWDGNTLTISLVERSSDNPEVLELSMQFQIDIDAEGTARLDEIADEIERKTGKRPAVDPRLDQPRIHWYMVIEQGVKAEQIEEAMRRGERILAEQGVEFEHDPNSKPKRVF